MYDRRQFLGIAAALSASPVLTRLLGSDPDTVSGGGCNPPPPPPPSPPGPGPAPSGTAFLPYTDDSFFKSSVLGAPEEHNRTVEFQRFMSTFPDQRPYPFPYINGVDASWGTSFAQGTSGDPIWKLTGPLNPKVADLGSTGFHAPSWLGDILTGTSDSPFCVQDLAGGFTVFGTKAKQTGPRTISVSTAGQTWHTSNGLSYRNPRSDDQRNFTSRGRISDSMVIRRDLVDQAIANETGLGHVLHMFIAETDTGFCHPMTNDEGNRAGFGQEGERIAIRPDVDLTMRHLTPFGLAVARTLQQHGCYIGDNAGRMSTLKAEQNTPGRNPWAGLEVSRQALAGVTWADFFVIPAGWPY